MHRRRRQRLADGTMPDGSSLPSRFRPLVPHLRLGPVRHKNTDRSECGRHVIFRILLRFQIWVCYFMIFVVFSGSGLVLPLSCGGWRWRFGISVVGAYRNSESERCSVGHTTVQGFIRQKMIFFIKPKVVERERVLDNGKWIVPMSGGAE